MLANSVDNSGTAGDFVEEKFPNVKLTLEDDCSKHESVRILPSHSLDVSVDIEGSNKLIYNKILFNFQGKMIMFKIQK